MMMMMMMVVVRRRGAEAEDEEEGGGMETEKQKPHKTTWGKIFTYSSMTVSFRVSFGV